MQQIKTVFYWAFVSVFLLVAELLAYILTPVVVLFADRNTGRLPVAFWWMETPTAALPGPRSITGAILHNRGWWAASVYWLWRNSVYALADKFRVDPNLDEARLSILTWWPLGTHMIVGDDPYSPGITLLTMKWLDGWAFELRICIPMPAGKCCFIRAGWKLSAWFQGRRPAKPTATGMLQVLSVRPWQSRG